MSNARNPLGWYAATFPATYVLLSFTATPTPPGGLWRPLLAAIAVGLLVQLMLTLVLRRPARAALLASAILCVALATWIPVLVLAAGGLWLLLIAWRRRDGGPRWSEERLSRVVQAFAWLLLVVAAVPAIGAVVGGLPPQRAATGVAAAGAEDVVVLLLDGYPRADVLRERFDIDQEAFAAALAQRGFEVADESRSNYSSTWMTLASMLNGRYVEEIPGLADGDLDAGEQYRRLMRAISGGVLLDEFRARGYEIVTVPSPYESAALNGADRILAPAQLTSFELSLVQHSLAGRALLEVAPAIAFDQHRDRVIASLDIVAAEMATDRERPRLMLVHVLAPHAPIAFGDAEEDPAPDCFPACSLYHLGHGADWTRYDSHLAAVNTLVLDAVDHIREASPEATILAMSDHGTVGPTRELTDAFASFFAARVPDGRLTFPGDVSPVDVLRLVLDPSSQATPYRAWLSEEERPMTVVDAHETADE